jgi:CRISPR type III-B/RAMP module RAMP protein Cmr1
MKTETFHLELITPCFCAGANQAVAEIRAASIRGQLRWWFRALLGAAEDESLIFGSAAGDSGSGSSVRITVSDVKPASQRTLPSFSPNDPQSYVWHYASVSGTTERGAKGPRWQPQGALPVGTTFKIHVTWLREFPALKSSFDEALFAFLTLGAVGLRASRGLGAFHCDKATDLQKMISILETKSFTIKRRTNPDTFSDYSRALRDWASWLRYRLRKDHKAERPSPLGSSEPRQASAVHFRPIQVGKNGFTWLAFEAPAIRVLGSESRKSSPLLANYDFSGPAPAQEPRSRRY